MMEPLDMAELAAACGAAGSNAVYHDGLLAVYVKGEGWRRWNPAQGEHPVLALVFLDAVRDALRALQAPGDRRLDEIALDRFEHYRVARRWLDSPIEEFSTEGAARALVALYRAGLLPEGRG